MKKMEVLRGHQRWHLSAHSHPTPGSTWGGAAPVGSAARLPRTAAGGPQKPPPPPAGPLEQLAKGSTRGPKGGECNWARGWPPDPVGGGGEELVVYSRTSILSPASTRTAAICPFKPRRPAEVGSFPTPLRGGPSSLRTSWFRRLHSVSGGGSRGLPRGSRLYQGKQQMLYIRPRPSQVLTVYLRASAHGDLQGPWKKLVSRGGRGASRHLQGRRELISRRSSVLPGEAGWGGPRTVGPTPSSFKEAEKRSLCSVQGLTARGESTPDLPAPRQCSFC